MQNINDATIPYIPRAMNRYNLLNQQNIPLVNRQMCQPQHQQMSLPRHQLGTLREYGSEEIFACVTDVTVKDLPGSAHQNKSTKNLRYAQQKNILHILFHTRLSA